MRATERDRTSGSPSSQKGIQQLLATCHQHYHRRESTSGQAEGWSTGNRGQENRLDERGKHIKGTHDARDHKARAKRPRQRQGHELGAD